MAEILASITDSPESDANSDGAAELLRHGLWRDRRGWRMKALNYYRARGREVGRAAACLRQHVLWREEWQADQIAEDGPRVIGNFELLHDYWPSGYFGEDRRGLPILVERMGELDVEGLKMCPMRDIVHFHIYGQEEMLARARGAFERLEQAEWARLEALAPEERARAEAESFLGAIAGRREEAIPTVTVTIIEDIGALGMRHMNAYALGLLKQLIEIDENQYVETIEKCFVTNAPSMFTIMWAVVKPWVDPVTLAKMAILGADPSRALLAEIDADQLPRVLGGSADLEGGFPGGPGGKFGYTREDGTTISPVETTVGRRSSHQVRLSVGQAPARVRWQVAVAAHDIGFAIKRASDDSVVLAPQRIGSGEPSESSIEVDVVGEYVVEFDNSYSTLRSKSLTFQFFIESL